MKYVILLPFLLYTNEGALALYSIVRETPHKLYVKYAAGAKAYEKGAHVKGVRKNPWVFKDEAIAFCDHEDSFPRIQQFFKEWMEAEKRARIGFDSQIAASRRATEETLKLVGAKNIRLDRVR